MCGIAGVLNFDGEPVSPVVLQAHDGRDSRIAAPTARVTSSTARSDSAIAGWRSSTSVAGRPPADGDAAMAATSLTYNGEVYNFQRAARRAGSARPPVPLAHRLRGRAQGVRANGASDALTASTACSRSRSGTAKKRTLLLARDRYGIKPLYYAARDGMLAVRLGDQGAARRSAASARLDRPRRAGRVFHFPELLHRSHAVRGHRLLPAGSHHARSAAIANPEIRALLGLSVQRSRDTAGPRRNTSKSSIGSSGRR